MWGLACGRSRRTIGVYLLLDTLVGLSISFVSAYYVTFLNRHGLDELSVNLVNASFYLTMFLTEVPTGVIADIYGRKASFCCSCLLLSFSLFIYAISTTFAGFILAEVVGAIGATCYSGAYQAWIVDQLKCEGFTGRIEPILARGYQLKRAFGMGGAIVGVYLGQLQTALPLAVAGMAMLITFFLAVVMIQETYPMSSRGQEGGRVSIVDVWPVTQAAYQLTKHTPATRMIFGLMLVQVFCMQGPNMQWQPWFSRFFGPAANGYVEAGIMIFLIIGAGLTHRGLRFASQWQLLLVAQVAIGSMLAFAGVSAAGVSLMFFYLHEVGRGFFQPVADGWLHEVAPSELRATVVSFQSIAHHLGGVGGLIVSGCLAKYASISITWVVLGLLLTVSVVPFCRNRRP